jgi:hypothetical protein
MKTIYNFDYNKKEILHRDRIITVKKIGSYEYEISEKSNKFYSIITESWDLEKELINILNNINGQRAFSCVSKPTIKKLKEYILFIKVQLDLN